MYLIIYSKDDTPAGRIDISEITARGLQLRFVDARGRGRTDTAAERTLHTLINKALAHEATLKEAVELSLVEILKQIAADATAIGGGSPNFRVPGDLINQARDAIAAEEGP